MGRTHVRAAYITVHKRYKGKKKVYNKRNRDNFLWLGLMAPQATVRFTTGKWKWLQRHPVSVLPNARPQKNRPSAYDVSSRVYSQASMRQNKIKSLLFHYITTQTVQLHYNTTQNICIYTVTLQQALSKINVLWNMTLC